MVIGPGQNLSITISASFVTDLTKLYTCFLSPIWTINGLSLGLPLLTASSSKAFAPNPYTVSVGKITVSPALKISACFFISSMSILSTSILLINVSIFIPPLFI